MKILLVTVSRNRKGQPNRAERVLEADTVRLGRGTQCEIHLPDPRVAYDHATIYAHDGGLFISAPQATIVVNGSETVEAQLLPGARIELGPYDLTVEPRAAGVDLALAIELARPLPDGLGEIREKSRTSLTSTALSKRRPAWILAIVVAVIFLALPVINAVIPPLRYLTSMLEVTPDQSWNPGELSSGHQAFGNKCGACHEIPFVRVRDRACLECHGKIPGHVLPASLESTLFGGTRCASCHVDHKGPASPVQRDAGLCTDCHNDLKRQKADTKLADAADFALSHPEFKLTLWTGPGKDDVVRVVQSNKAALLERSHLKFPHDVHLKTSVRGPKGRKTLECRSCHVADGSGRQFVPVDMKKACVECHTLEFEPAVTTRQVVHGNVDDVLLTMQEFYANIALNNIPVDVVDIGEIRRSVPRLAGGTISEEERRRALAWAKQKAAAVAQDLIEARVCIVCHEVTKTVNPGERGVKVAWNVVPPHVAAAWLPKARFDHSKHATGEQKCDKCHDVLKSHSSADIALPDIASCRVCHAGSEPAANKVVSTCVSCHGFHLPGHPPMGKRTDADRAHEWIRVANESRSVQ